MVVLDEIYLIILAGLSIIFGILFGHFIVLVKNHFKKSIPENTDKLTSNRDDIKKNESGNTGNQKQLLELKRVDQVSDQYILNKNSHKLEDEIKLYQFEKDLVTRAIENILIASRNKTIDDLERDRLLIKYKEQLGSLNQNMDRIQSQMDITKLMNFRDDFTGILENKISQIDEKITTINDKYKSLINTGFENKSYNLKGHDMISSNNEVQGKNNLKNTLNRIFNYNPNSKYTKNLLDTKRSKEREIVDYKVDRAMEGEVEEEERIQDIRFKVMNALDSLENIKPLEDSIENEIESINNEEDKEQTEKEEIKLYKKDANNDNKEDIKILNVPKRDTKESNKFVNINSQQENSETLLKESNTAKKKNENKFPLASFFSRQNNQNKIEDKTHAEKNIIKDEEKLQNRNPLGNIFKNI